MDASLAVRLAELGISPARLAARGLQPYAEADAASLVLADMNDAGREFHLLPGAATAWQAMRDAAAADGVTLFLVSAFRSVARQYEIVAAKLARGQCLDTILAVSAAPGFSEHHTGRAIDIGTPGSPVLEEHFETTPAFAWLQQHAANHGFAMSFDRNNASGYLYEPWHWCWQDPAAQPTSKGLTA
ncbi:M15 family metallopeptidase [Vogesella sp. DC21W]|uniref:M15 family metallopeptidase n=1 Tax=Vogesella aquatica TaxID=2984206 RepID=A0ABT5IXZ6_9NEIS|nr:M15 family metallopeptidase [Vogesella aquatica]MDC7717033.1 M15 family metallopeptidase [Vogesella aquatica]